MTDSAAPRVLHLDHTSAAGGAEYALMRMLRGAVPWRPALLVPPSGRGGVYAPLGGRVPIRTGGVAQPAGVSGGGLGAVARAAVRLMLQAAATRLDPAFRSADVVDANTARAAAYGALAARTSRRPFVLHLRDMVEAEALGGSGLLMMTRIALPRADGVVANSRATLESARPWLRPDAVTAVIPSAAGLHPVPAGASRAARGEAGPLRIGILARIDPWKGQALLLEAFARAFGDGDAVLEFAGAPQFGTEPHLEELRTRAAELGLGDRVRFLGHVDDLDAVLARWDIAVQCSTRPEPLGQNVLQYLAAGCATIVADEGGPAEWIDDGVNGLGVPARDAPALAAALERLAGDGALRVALATAAPSTTGLLDDDAVAPAHGAFYAEVVTSRTTRGS